MKNLLGSNQYKTRKQVNVGALILATPIALAIYIGLESLVFFLKSFKSLRNPAPYLLVFTLLFASTAIAAAPKADLSHEYIKPVIATQPTEREQIVTYINEVFGKDASNAIKVFTCESGLNPRAYNDNTSWGGVGHDLGVAQINDHYQMVTNKDFLYDYKINILMAKQIFDKWGHNFHAWTCGRKLGL